MQSRKKVHLRYGRGELEIAVPAGAEVFTGHPPPALADPVAAVREALARPIGAPPLRELIQRKKPRSAAITISDITRPVPNKVILPALLEALNRQGVADADIVVLIGTGMHRPSTAAELEELVGQDILRRVRVIDHRADDGAALTRVSQNPPASVNALFVQADFRIVTGLIEPHFMAGFSGGRKGVCPALVDLATVQRFHGHAILSDPRSTTGVLEGNPCHEESLRVARLVGVDFLVNVAIGGDRQLAGVYAGQMEAAHEAGVADVSRWTGAAIDRPFDLIVTSGGGYPLDQTFYQSVKGMVAALPAAHEKSVILIASDCREGIGSKSYAEIMLKWAGDWRGFLRHIQQTPQVEKDQWQYQMHARVLEALGVERLRMVSDGLPAEVLAKLSVTPVTGAGPAAARLQGAIDGFLAEHPQARVAVTPEGPYTMLLRQAETAGV